MKSPIADDPPRIGLVSPIMGFSNIAPFNRMVRILSLLSSDLFVVRTTIQEAKEIEKIPLNERGIAIVHRRGAGTVSSMVSFAVTQLVTCFWLLRSGVGGRVWVFYLGDTQALPILLERLLGNKVILLIGGSLETEIMLQRGRYRDSTKILNLMKMLSLRLASRIVVYSSRLISVWGLQPYQAKTAVAGEHFIDGQILETDGQFLSRPEVVGFVGNVNEVKGAMSFARSIPIILNSRPHVRFVIVGDGDQRQEIFQMLNQQGLLDRVDMTGRVDRALVPDYIRRMRLMVIPSSSEGLPNVLLEAMACGTPVLATRVGAIPDIIVEGVTGFLMESNSPECIANNVIRAVEAENIAWISRNARTWVGQEFTLERSKYRWKEIVRF